MQDANVTEDDARQVEQHAAVKSKVEHRVNAEIAGEAMGATTGGQARIVEVAGQLRDNAVNDAAQGERVLGRARTAARGSQFLDYAFYVVYSLLTVRLGLTLIAAQPSNGFVQFIDTITNPFYAPFRGIVSSPSVDGGYTLAVPILIAIVAYMLLHAAINGLLRMVGSRKTQV